MRMCADTPASDKQRLQSNVLKSISVFTGSVAIGAMPALAKVYFDTEVYGDKELKIATVNKIKQRLRNEILQDYTLAPDMLKLALNDALGYDAASEGGGADGSIQFEMDRDQNKGLQRAIDAIERVRKLLQRTTQVPFADLCAFAGAVALEAVGSDRITVQLGRFGAKVANRPDAGIQWDDPSTAGVLTAFTSAGLTSRDAVLLIGALGEVNRVSAEAVKAAAAARGGDDDDEDFEPQPFVPTTFGARDAIYGSKVGKGDFGSQYFKDLLKGKASGDAVGNALLADANSKAMIQKYAGNEDAFVKEVTDAYFKLTQLGEAYTTRNS